MVSPLNMITTLLILALLWSIPSAILLVFICMCSSRFNESLVEADDLEIYSSDQVLGTLQRQENEIPTQPLRSAG